MTDEKKPYLFRGVKGQKKGTDARILSVSVRNNAHKRIQINISDDWVIRTNGKIETIFDKITDMGKMTTTVRHLNDADTIFTRMDWHIAFTQDEPVEDQIEWVMEQIEIADRHKITEWKMRSGDFWTKRIGDLRDQIRNAPHPYITWGGTPANPANSLGGYYPDENWERGRNFSSR